MAAIRSKDTQPEMEVRRAIHHAGFRYRLHRRDLPGAPDLIFPRYRLAAFVHGCFWHGHRCPMGNRPRTNSAYWREKVRRNRARDRRAARDLQALGWSVATIRECSLPKDTRNLLLRLRRQKQRTGR